MRAAVVTPYLPWPADTGGKLRSYYLLKGLAAAAEVDLFTVCHGKAPTTTELGKFCRQVTVIPLQPPTQREQLFRAWLDGRPRSVRYFQDEQSLQQIQAQLATNSYDLLVCDEIAMASYFAGQADLPSIIMRQKIDYLHYAESATSRAWGIPRILDALEARRLQHFEATMMPQFQGAVVCSPGDAQVAASQGPSLEIEIIVNGADVTYFTPQRQPDLRPTLLLLGTMHYQPNIDMVLYFFRTIHPQLVQTVPDLQVLIVGHQPPPELTALGALPGVTVTGSVDDVRPYMARSWLLAVPLRLGGGTRLKIIEAMATGLPVVSTTVGAQGLDDISQRLVTIADEPAAFASAVQTLLQDEQRRATLSHGGRQAVVERYSWQQLGERFASFCHQIAAG